jgi:hypothetical protein
MAEYGEWNRKGAVLSDVTATKEFGVSREFIVEGIRAGKLEFRHGSVWGNPYLRVLRRELEAYIAERLGEGAFRSRKAKAELKKVNKEIAELERQLAELRVRKARYEADAAADGETGGAATAGAPTARKGRRRSG